MALTQVAGGLIASGQTITSPTLSSPTINGTPVMGASVITSGTAVASTSGTSIDFTSIPAWVKKITVMFNGVSTNGASFVQVQIGAGSVTTSGYVASSSMVYGTNLCLTTTATSGFVTWANGASDARSGHFIITNVSSNIWVASGVLNAYSEDGVSMSAGTVTLGGTLDRVRITTVTGSDTFDAGSINILYE
jgi:hypothetical protein